MSPAATDERLRSDPDRWLRVGEVALDLAGVVVHVGDARVPLTYREFLVLRALMVRAGRVVTRLEILDDAWGEHRPRARMVDVYIRRIRSRLGDRDAVEGDGGARRGSLEQHIRAVRGQGYVFAAPDATPAPAPGAAAPDPIPQPRRR